MPNLYRVINGRWQATVDCRFDGIAQDLQIVRVLDQSTVMPDNLRYLEEAKQRLRQVGVDPNLATDASEVQVRDHEETD